MEGQLDTRRPRSPTPGNVGLHRLNRTEYAREIDRLLGLDVDVKTLLPKDVSSDGFDNIAAVLRISPTFLEQYIAAARNMSRQAIGRAQREAEHARSIASQRHADQNEHIDGLPLGTRGGLIVDHYFPADGEYEFNIREFFFGGAGYVTKVDTAHDVIMTIDDVRVFEATVGGAEDLKAVDQRQAAAADEMQTRFNHIRVRVKAGPASRRRRVHPALVRAVGFAAAADRDAAGDGARADDSGRRHLGPVQRHGHRRHGEPQARLHLHARRIASRKSSRARSASSRSLASEAFRRPVDGRGPEGAAWRSITMGRESGGDFEAGIESGAHGDSLEHASSCSAPSRSAADRHRQSRCRSRRGSRARVAAVVLPLERGPDRELHRAGDRRQAAATRKCSKPRCIACSRTRARESLVTNFAFQWLNVGKIDSDASRTRCSIRTSIAICATGFREEMRLFLDSVLRENRSVLDLLRSDETFLNERLALQYGMPNVRGAQFRPVRLTDPNRFGLARQGRGADGHVLRQPHVAGAARRVDSREHHRHAADRAAAGRRGSSRRPKPARRRRRCASGSSTIARIRRATRCHGVIDPLGFALENFDVVGAWRDEGSRCRQRHRCRAASLPNGTHVSGPSELRKALLARPDQFVQALTEKLMTFALGRGLRYQDMPTVRAIVRDGCARRLPLRSRSSRGIVASPAFQMRAVPTRRRARTPQQAALIGADRTR